MDKQLARQQESDDADTDTEQTPSEQSTAEATESTPDAAAAVDHGRRGDRSVAGQTPTIEEGQPTGPSPARSPDSAYVDYSAGSNSEALAARYDMRVGEREAGKLARLEAEFGSGQVSRWAEEGMRVETMGKPRDMQAFRERQDERPAAVPTDIERRTQASKRRNATADSDDGPAGETSTPEAVRSVVSSPGRAMDETVQREMESRMGGEFGDVRLHTGPAAAAAADSLGARAFTVGNHVAFNRGEYQPASNDGKALLAHELTHVRQRTEGTVSLLPKAEEARPAAESARAATHVQPKLEVSSPDDPAEREAERVAEQVVQMDAGATGESEAPVDRRKRDLGLVRTVPLDRAQTAQGSGDGGVTESTVRGAVRGGGKPLPSGQRAAFESKMGADFSDVRVHTGAAANEAAQSINAKAYTMGSDIAFAEGQYNPQSSSGQKLLAHELTHVAQQGGADRQVQRQESAGTDQSGGGSILVEDGVSISGDNYTITMRDSSKYEYYRFEEVGGLGALNLNRCVVMSTMNGTDPELAVLDLSAGQGVHAQGSDEVGTLFQNLSKQVQSQGYPNGYAFGYIQSKLLGGSGTTGFHVAYEFLVWQERQAGGGSGPSLPASPADAEGQTATFPSVQQQSIGNKYMFFMSMAGYRPSMAAVYFALHKAAVYNGWSYALGVSGSGSALGALGGGGGIVFLPGGGVGVYGSASLGFAAGLDVGADVEFTAVAGGIGAFTGKVITYNVTVGPVGGELICEVRRNQNGKKVAGDEIGVSFSAGLSAGLEFLGTGVESTGVL